MKHIRPEEGGARDGVGMVCATLRKRTMADNISAKKCCIPEPQSIRTFINCLFPFPFIDTIFFQ